MAPLRGAGGFLGGGRAPSTGWEVAGMECGCAIMAAPGVLVGASGCHFDSLGIPAGALVASSVISAAQMGALGIFSFGTRGIQN